MRNSLVIILLLAITLLVNHGFAQQIVKMNTAAQLRLDGSETSLPDSLQASSAFEAGNVVWQAVLSGGSFSTSQGMLSRDALGQVAVGSAATQDYKIYQGFLQSFLLSESCQPGDADGDGEVDVDDVIFLLNYIFSDGPEPVDFCCADANGDGAIDIDDVVYIIHYSFAGGPEPRRGC